MRGDSSFCHRRPAPRLVGAVLLLLVGMMTAFAGAGPPPLAAAAAPTARSPADALRGRLVTVSADGTRLVDAPDTLLAGKKLLAFYFSAGWCQTCHAFTPRLAAFYRQMRPMHPGFEVILVSADRSEEEMQRYLRESRMPWPALRFAALKDVPEITGLVGEGVPQLVLLDAVTGKVLSSSTQGDGSYVGPERVLVEFQLRLSGGK